MKRRPLLAELAGAVPVFAGCTSLGPRASTPPTLTADAKPGSVDNHRITAVEALSHEAVRRTTDDGSEWIIRVRLQLTPQDTETATPAPIGVFFIFLDAEGRELHQEHEQIPANTGNTARTVPLSAVFPPDEADDDTFHRYRIELVHA